MSEEKKQTLNQEDMREDAAKKEQEISPTWAQDALADLDDWIEEQGIYLRQ